MEDKFTLFAALACAVAILIAMWWEYRPSFSWVRYLFGFDEHDSDTMPWDEVVGRIERRAYICEQRGERGDNERAAVRAEYISWIARRFI